MTDPALIRKICDYASLGGKESVLEIGAGTGNLTAELAGRAGRVYAIEKDPRLFSVLEGRLKGALNVELICGDALRMHLPETDLWVSNMPYSISRKAVERMLSVNYHRGVIVFQREFAEKLVARPGSDSYRFISAYAQSCAEIEVLDTIPPEAFSPRPRVYSSIVRFRQSLLPEKEYVRFLRTLFTQKNKTLGKVLRTSVPSDYAKKRAGRLTPEELRRLYLIILGVIEQ